MENLAQVQVPASTKVPSEVRHFSKVGVDFTDSFDVKATMIWKIKITKAYICIFICKVNTVVYI